MVCASSCLQHEPEPPETPCDMEDVLPRSSAAAQWFLRLPTGGTDVTYQEDPGETRPGAAQAYGLRPHLDPLQLAYQ